MVLGAALSRVREPNHSPLGFAAGQRRFWSKPELSVVLTVKHIVLVLLDFPPLALVAEPGCVCRGQDEAEEESEKISVHYSLYARVCSDKMRSFGVYKYTYLE